LTGLLSERNRAAAGRFRSPRLSRGSDFPPRACQRGPRREGARDFRGGCGCARAARSPSRSAEPARLLMRIPATKAEGRAVARERRRRRGAAAAEERPVRRCCRAGQPQLRSCQKSSLCNRRSIFLGESGRVRCFTNGEPIDSNPEFNHVKPLFHILSISSSSLMKRQRAASSVASRKMRPKSSREILHRLL
jgi:hypothetical protein